MKKNNLLLVIFTVCILFSNTSFSQNSYSSIIKFNVPVNGQITNTGGLEVKCVLLSTKDVSEQQATLDGEPARYLKKRLFTLFITVTNTGTNDILISDWHFRAFCPENLHGQQWQENSYIKLITPYFPTNTNIILIPNQKKSFSIPETDFFWCSPKHIESLMTPPCIITALIACRQVRIPIYTTKKLPGFSKFNCQYIDYDKLLNTGKPKTNRTSGNPNASGLNSASGSGKEQPAFERELLALIEEYKKALASGNMAEAAELKTSILDIASHAYPDRIDEINVLMDVPSLKKKPSSDSVKTSNTITEKAAPPTPTPIVSTKVIPRANSNFSDWQTVKNPYQCLQVRFKLEKQENDIGYYNVQFRIDFEDKSFCTHPRCLGYLVSFGYPTLDGKDNIYSYFKFYNSYKQVYTVPDLMPIKLSFSDGSKRVLKNDGFYFITKDSGQEVYCAQLFDKCVDQMMEGSPTSCRGFNESKCLILK